MEERTRLIIQEVIKASKESDHDPNTVLDDVSKNFAEVRTAVTKTVVYDLQNDTDKIGEMYQSLIDSGFQIKTGFQKLDDVVPLRAGDLVLLCGASGRGKSLSAIKILSQLINDGVPSVFFSLEMSLIEVTNRLLPMMGRFSFSDLHFGKIPKADYEKAVKETINTQCHIVTRQTEGKIDLGTVERYVTEYKPKVVFIDYLGLVDGADLEWNAVISPTAEMKRIALQHNVLIICLIQADTGSMQNNEVPSMTNVRGNKGIAFDANVFIGMTSERYATDDDRFKFSFAVGKSRNGGCPSFSFRVIPNLGIWETSDGESW